MNLHLAAATNSQLKPRLLHITENFDLPLLNLSYRKNSAYAHSHIRTYVYTTYTHTGVVMYVLK